MAPHVDDVLQPSKIVACSDLLEPIFAQSGTDTSKPVPQSETRKPSVECPDVLVTVDSVDVSASGSRESLLEAQLRLAVSILVIFLI